MKIDGNNDIARSVYTDKATQKETTADSDFKDILKASVERTQQTSVPIQSPAQVASLGAIRFAPLSPETRQTTVERLDNLLNLLDQYRDQLADPRVTLRQIEPLLNTIAQEKEQLSTALNALPDEDGLKDIVHRTLITTSLELMKYNRGDYIPAD
jgi:ABC-type transporter Mla subunit MlaD